MTPEEKKMKKDLQKTFEKLSEMSERDVKRAIDKGIKEFAEGEANPDPIPTKCSNPSKPKA